MDIKATILFDASPALLQVAESLVKLASCATVFVTQPHSTGPAAPASLPAEAEARPSAGPVPAPTSAGEKPTLEQVRVLTAEKIKTNKEAVRKALAECGAQSIPTLAEDRFADYLAKLAAL